MNGQQLPGLIEAASAYGGGGGGSPTGGSFERLIQEPAIRRWDAEAAAERKVIPTVVAGADARPRYWKGPHPCPWSHQGGTYVTDPTMAQLENFLRASAARGTASGCCA